VSVQAIDDQLSAQLHTAGDIEMAVAAVLKSGDPDGMRKIMAHAIRRRAEAIADAIARLDRMAMKSEQKPFEPKSRDSPPGFSTDAKGRTFYQADIPRDPTVRGMGFYLEGHGYCDWLTATAEQLRAYERDGLGGAEFAKDGAQRKRRKKNP